MATQNAFLLFFELKRYQKRLYFLLFVSAIFNAFPALIPLVASYVPEFDCDVSDVIKANVSTAERKKFLSFYMKNTSNSVGQYKLSSCYHHNLTWEDYIEYNETGSLSPYSNNLNQTGLCKKHIFHFEEGESSAAVEFEMYCDQADRKSYVVTLYMLGMLTGTVISGFLSDSFGRKYVFLGFQYLQFIMFFFAGFVKSFEMYCLVVFFYGTSGLVNYMSAIVLGTELTKQTCRNLISTSIQLAFGISYMIFPLFAYYIRDWRWFYWVGGACGVIYIPYIWLIDESPRWLYSAGKREEAEKIIEKISKINGEESNLQEYVGDESKEQRSKTSWVTQIRILFTNRTLLLRLLIMGSAWCMLTVSYYGIAMTTNDLSGDRFMNCFISGASETISYFLSYLVVEYFGRRNPYIVCTMLASVTIAVAPFLGLWNTYFTTFMTFVAKFFISISFYIVYVMTPEMFPTQLRHTTTALDSGLARVGGIIVSFILYKDKFVTAPIVGAIIFILTLPVLTMPKTHNIPLPETIEEALALDNGWMSCGKKQRKKRDPQQIEDTEMSAPLYM